MLKKHKVMSQTKGQDKPPEKELKEVEIGKLPEKEFRIMIVKMIQDLRNRMEKMQEMFSEDLEELKNKQRWNNRLKGKNRRRTEAEEQINVLDDRKLKITAIEHNTEKEWKEMKTAWDLWDNIKHTNIHIIGVPEGEEKEKVPEKIFEKIIAEKFCNMGKEIVNQVQEAQRVPGKINPRSNTW